MPSDIQNVKREILINLARDTEKILGLKHREIKVDQRANIGSIISAVNAVKDELIWRFQLIEMPGCCAFLISTGTFVNHNYRKLGIGNMLQKYKENIAKDWRYTNLVATTTEKNKAQTKIMNKAGWEMLFHIVNSRTKNTLMFWRKKL